jgi:hypothetical protein
MELIHEMTYHALVRPALRIGDGPFGARIFAEVISAEVDGGIDRVRRSVLPDGTAVRDG